VKLTHTKVLTENDYRCNQVKNEPFLTTYVKLTLICLFKVLFIGGGWEKKQGEFYISY
jgi:hypothetical protein